MPLPLNTFGLLGEKSKRSEEILPSFGGTERFQEFGLRTTGNTFLTAQQILFPIGDPGIYLFELFVAGINIVGGTPLVLAGGFVGCSVDNFGAVTLSADANTGLVDYISAVAVTNVAVVARNSTALAPAALNINVIGLASQTIQWTGRIRLMCALTRDTVLPLGRSDVSPTQPIV